MTSEDLKRIWFIRFANQNLIEMKQGFYVVVLFIITLMAGCSISKKVAEPVVSAKSIAEKAASEGNYTQAAEAWKQYFSQTPVEQVAGADFASAAQTAFKSGDLTQSVIWFDQARYKNFADAPMYLTLAEIYRTQKNISKELTALEFIDTNFPDQKPLISERLFMIYNEIKEPDKALNSWKQMGEGQKSNLTNLNAYFGLMKNLKDTVQCDEVSMKILEKDPENVPALEWNAFKYYWLGEKRFQREMEIYNRNKTNKQYKILLAELDKSTADFKTSLTYLEKLWKIDPGKTYASYFAVIYARFGDEAKSQSYEKYQK